MLVDRFKQILYATKAGRVLPILVYPVSLIKIYRTCDET